MARFALFTNGVKVETLDDLKENFNIKDVLENFRKGSLERWLMESRLSDLAQQVSVIKKEASDQSVIFKLFNIFALSDEQIERANKQEEIRQEEERILREKAIRENVQDDTPPKAILTNEDLELFWDDTELGRPDVVLHGCEHHTTFSVMKDQFISIGDALYFSPSLGDEHFYESKDGINCSKILEVETILSESQNEKISRIQHVNGKLFLSVIDNRDIQPWQVDFYVKEGETSAKSDFGEFGNYDFIIKSDSNRSSWTVARTKNGSPTWGISVTDSECILLNLRVTHGYHDRKKVYPLESTQDIEHLYYFKGGYIAAGHWFSLGK